MTSPPSTPVINEENKNAALKLFAAYNGKKEHINPTITSIQQGEVDNALNIRDIMSCGIQGGSVFFNSSPDIDHEPLDRHGILRSYTIGSDYRTVDSSRWKYKINARKTSSYTGSPYTTPRRNTSDTEKDVDSNEIQHCYPIIKIINENNVEQSRYSDSEESVDKVNTTMIDVKPQPPESKPQPDVLDSGYPSTTLSNATQCSMDDVIAMHNASSASERRKMFTSKSKSASFYNIGSMDMETIPVINTIQSSHYESPTGTIECRRSFHADLKGSSFESDRCRSCQRDEIKRLAYSYESDLDKLHKHRNSRQYTFDDRYHYSRHKQQHRRHKCGCDYKHRRSSRDVAYHSKRSAYSKAEHSFSSCRGSNERVDRLRYLDNHHGHLYSSTDSDSYIETARANRLRRQHYYLKGSALSENLHSRRRDSFEMNSHDQKHLKQYSFKTRQMHSFLKDAYKANGRGCDNAVYAGIENFPHGSETVHAQTRVYFTLDNVEEQSPLDPRQSINFDRRSKTMTDKESDNMVHIEEPDKPPYTYPSYARPNNDNQFSFSEGSVRKYLQEDENIELPDKLKCVSRDQSSASDKNVSNTDESISGMSEHGYLGGRKARYSLHEKMKLKDSAYQTKQSSVDKFKDDISFSNSSSVKHRQGHPYFKQVSCFVAYTCRFN